MFADDNSIENIQQLFFDFKKYLELQKKYTQLEVAEKLTILLSTLILVLLVVILGMVALFYLSFTLAYILDPIVGGLMVSFAMISCFHILLIALIVAFRKKVIINPMAKFIAGLFIDNNKNYNIMDMNDTVQTEILTLEDLQRQKAEALEELRAQKQVMNDTARNLFAPIAPAANKGTAIMRAFNTGMAVFDGAMLGIKLMKKVRKIFRR